MTKRKTYPLIRQYIFNCRITRRTEVIVEAMSEAEAMDKFSAMKWVYEHPCGEIVDFTHDRLLK